MLKEYTLDDTYQQGSYAWVHFGTRNSDKTRVAVKFSQTSDKEALTRFNLEHQILKQLSDEQGVVDVYTDVLKGERENVNRHYYVMERLEYNLEQWLDIAFASDNDRTKIEIIKQIYTTLKTVHDRGYVHRDLHDGNILIDTINSAIISKITDFGRAYSFTHPTKVSHPNRPAWGMLMIPPEISFGVIDPDDKEYKNGDFYAAGMLVKTIFTGGLDVQGLLSSMQGSIKKFKQDTTQQLYTNYLSNRTAELRKIDYEKWCGDESANFESQYPIDLIDREASEKISTLIYMSSAIDYSKRELSSDKLIEFIKGI